MSTETRKYEQRKRAESVAETRRRITEAAVELHETVGPARTTMSAVAQRAGVQRQTLYRHFPSEEALLGACSAMFWEHAPPPDAAAWRSIRDPGERLSAGLDETYRYFERAAPMLAGVERDRESIPGVESHMAPFDAFHERALDVLSAGWGARGARARLVRTAVAHALAFETWASLVRDGGATRPQAVELIRALVAQAAAG
jgi:AcrR family transcriptional regulator